MIVAANDAKFALHGRPGRFARPNPPEERRPSVALPGGFRVCSLDAAPQGLRKVEI